MTISSVLRNKCVPCIKTATALQVRKAPKNNLITQFAKMPQSTGLEQWRGGKQPVQKSHTGVPQTRHTRTGLDWSRHTRLPYQCHGIPLISKRKPLTPVIMPTPLPLSDWKMLPLLASHQSPLCSYQAIYSLLHSVSMFNQKAKDGFEACLFAV